MSVQTTKGPGAHTGTERLTHFVLQSSLKKCFCFLSLSRLVEGCPLATLRAGPECVTNVHVQNLMVSITKPLYMECT